MGERISWDTGAIPTFPTGKINMDKVIRSWAEANEMSFRDAMGYMSKRPSLGIVTDLLGLSRSQADSVGEFLDRCGYSVPRRLTNVDSDNQAQEEDEPKPSPHREEPPSIDSSQPLTAERYLQLRTDGRSNAQIRAAYPDLMKLLEEWHWVSPATQRKAMQHYKNTGQALVSYARGMHPSQFRTRKKTEASKGEPNVSITHLPAKTGEATASSSIDLTDFAWISPSFTPKRDEPFRITKRAVRLGTWAARRFQGAERVEVGVKPGMIVIKPSKSTSAWKIRIHTKSTGIYIGHQRLMEAVERAGFQVGCAMDGRWEEDLGVMVITLR